MKRIGKRSRPVKAAELRLADTVRSRSRRAQPPGPKPVSEPLAVILPRRPRPEVVLNGNEPAEPRPTARLQRDALQLYFRDLGQVQVQLLTPEEEVELAKRIQQGDEAARQRMIQANLRLVVKIAHEYEGLGLPLLDLINEGNIGLMKGVQRFDPAKGAKLSTYASFWIKQFIRRALANQSKTIRLPTHVVDKLAHLRRVEMKLREALGREPTPEELAIELGIPARRVRQYLEAAKAPVSLDAPLGTGEESDRVGEIVADASAAAPFNHLVRATDTTLMQESLATLSPREQKILTLRFGLTDGTPRTLEEIARVFGVTRERIRQIESQALKKLRRRMERRDRPPIEGIVALAE